MILAQPQAFSCEFCEMFYGHPFYGTPPDDCFWEIFVICTGKCMQWSPVLRSIYRRMEVRRVLWMRYKSQILIGKTLFKDLQWTTKSFCFYCTLSLILFFSVISFENLKLSFQYNISRNSHVLQTKIYNWIQQGGIQLDKGRLFFNTGYRDEEIDVFHHYLIHCFKNCVIIINISIITMFGKIKK